MGWLQPQRHVANVSDVCADEPRSRDQVAAARRQHPAAFSILHLGFALRLPWQQERHPSRLFTGVVTNAFPPDKRALPAAALRPSSSGSSDVQSCVRQLRLWIHGTPSAATLTSRQQPHTLMPNGRFSASSSGPHGQLSLKEHLRPPRQPRRSAHGREHEHELRTAPRRSVDSRRERTCLPASPC